MSNGIENFFKTQVTVFDQAVQFEKSLMMISTVLQKMRKHIRH